MVHNVALADKKRLNNIRTLATRIVRLPGVYSSVDPGCMAQWPGTLRLEGRRNCTDT